MSGCLTPPSNLPEWATDNRAGVAIERLSERHNPR